MADDFDRASRDALLARVRPLENRIFGREGFDALTGRESSEAQEKYFQLLAEYSDRLPRVAMSACPFTGEVLKRSFDPWGIDGPWWFQECELKIEEPSAPPSFRLLLGALALHGREPVEARDAVIPGPEVPFVVPRLLEMEGMVAVVSSLSLASGDTAYPIAYFSSEELAPERSHQPWLRQEHWFKTAEGASAWLIANDVWDFELEPWIASGKLKWIAPGDASCRVIGASDGPPCPYVGLAGEREPASLAAGERYPLPLPDGEMINPYED